MPKEKVPFKCLSIVMLDSVIKANKKYYPQKFSEECKYVQEKMKSENYIDDNLDSGSDDVKQNLIMITIMIMIMINLTNNLLKVF